MSTNAFVGYVGPPELHDGCIVGLEQVGDSVTVMVRGCTGQLITLEFLGVMEVNAVQAEGMVLYALVELAENASVRRFVFANWDEECDARLEVTARHFHILSKPEEQSQPANE